jgi:hypothetical protein
MEARFHRITEKYEYYTDIIISYNNDHAYSNIVCLLDHPDYKSNIHNLIDIYEDLEFLYTYCGIYDIPSFYQVIDYDPYGYYPVQECKNLIDYCNNTNINGADLVLVRRSLASSRPVYDYITRTEYDKWSEHFFPVSIKIYESPSNKFHSRLYSSYPYDMDIFTSL